MTESSLNKVCTPALIYVCFSMIQIFIDIYKQMYNTAFIKFWVMFVFTILLNILCSRGLGIISWFIVFIPFIFMTLIITILLFMFGLDPMTGRLKVKDDNNVPQENIIDYRQLYAVKQTSVDTTSDTTSDNTLNKSCNCVGPCNCDRPCKCNKKCDCSINANIKNAQPKLTMDEKINNSINDINNIVNKINDVNNLNN